LPADTNNTLVSKCTENGKCEWVCYEGYILRNNACRINPYICLGPDFSNATLCSSDDFNLTADTNKTLVSKCTDAKKCEYTCNSRYVLLNNSCQPNPYTCVGPDDPNSTLCPGEEIDLPANTNKTFVNQCTRNVKCEYYCNAGYRAIDNICQPRKSILITADNGYVLYVNGTLIGEQYDLTRLFSYDITNNLVAGRNIIAIKAIDWWGYYGLIAKFGYGNQTYGATGDIGWKCINLGRYSPPPVEPAGWQSLNFDDTSWPAPAVPTPGYTDVYQKLINLTGAQWIWTPTGGQSAEILCRYYLTL
jgi:hypothetical protein